MRVGPCSTPNTILYANIRCSLRALMPIWCGVYKQMPPSSSREEDSKGETHLLARCQELLLAPGLALGQP